MAKLNWDRVKADNLGHRRGNEYTAKTSGMTFGAPAKANRPYRPKKAKHPKTPEPALGRTVPAVGPGTYDPWQPAARINRQRIPTPVPPLAPFLLERSAPGAHTDRRRRRSRRGSSRAEPPQSGSCRRRSSAGWPCMAAARSPFSVLDVEREILMERYEAELGAGVVDDGELT